MRKTLVLFAASLFVASSVFAAISGSKHDFSTGTYQIIAPSGSAEICRGCHMPHNGDNSVAPLWGHQNTATTVWQPYASNTMNATVGTPSSISKACLACHDGTLAVDAITGGTAGGTTTKRIASSAAGYIGTDLRNDHPVSFNYDAALVTADSGLNAVNVAKSNLGGKTIEQALLFGTGTSKSLECSSCHDVHNGTPAIAKMLIVTNAGSALCLTCHNK